MLASIKRSNRDYFWNDPPPTRCPSHIRQHLWYNQIAPKIPGTGATAYVPGAGRTQGPRAATREVADDRFEPTHRSDNRCCRRGGKRSAASVRASTAGRGRCGIAGGRQGRILREGRRPHPLRRDRLGLPAAGDARRRAELGHRRLGACGDQHPGGVQRRLPRDHHGPAQRERRRVHRPGAGRRSLGRVRGRSARRDGPSRHRQVLFLRQLHRRPVRDEADGARAAARRRSDPEPAGRA